MSLRTFVLNMTVSESISKFGDTAVDSIDNEMRQMCDKHVWEGVTLDSLTPKQLRGIITSLVRLSMLLMVNLINLSLE
jgi:hypothetical protein